MRERAAVPAAWISRKENTSCPSLFISTPQLLLTAFSRRDLNDRLRNKTLALLE